MFTIQEKLKIYQETGIIKYKPNKTNGKIAEVMPEHANKFCSVPIVHARKENDTLLWSNRYDSIVFENEDKEEVLEDFVDCLENELNELGKATIKRARVGVYQPRNHEKTMSGISCNDFELIYLSEADFVESIPERTLQKIYDVLNKGNGLSSIYHGKPIGEGDIIVIGKRNSDFFMRWKPDKAYLIEKRGFIEVQDFYKDDVSHSEDKFELGMDVSEEYAQLKELSWQKPIAVLEPDRFPDWMLNDKYIENRLSQLKK